MDNKTAIIFGVTGQDGSYLSELLIGKGYKVAGVTRRSSVDNTERLYQVKNHPNFLLLEGDITDYISMSGVYHKSVGFFDKREPDEVYSLAAQSHVGSSFEQPLATFRIDAEGPLNVLEVIRREGNIKHTRFYQASSSELYGNSSAIQDENTPFAPTSPYAIAKLAAHYFVKMYREAYGMFACAGILFNHESPRRGDNFVTQKIARYVARLSKDTAIDKLQLGNIDSYRDWGYAPDYVRAMWMMLNSNVPDDYVIGTGETHSVREFCEVAFDCIGIDNCMKYIQVNESCLRPSDVNRLHACPAFAMKILDWKPSIDFRQLVQLMVYSAIAKLEGKDEIYSSS